MELSNDEICLTDKAADLMAVKEGDTVTLRDNDDKEINLKVSNIVHNYISHYIYMSKELYQKIYNEYETNVIFTQNVDLDEQGEEELAKQIMEKSEVGAISLNSSIIKMMDDMMKSLNYVVMVLIVSAGLLAFVVLYNLANVNISERIRELATIKVLGFYDKEVYNYISRETTILTIIGIILGLGGGYFLLTFILKTCEINILRFARVISPLSYIYAGLITIIFTGIVNIMTYFSLKKINMIESLKSVE